MANVLPEALFLELWSTMPDRAEELNVRVEGDAVEWLTGEFRRIGRTLSRIASESRGFPPGTPHPPDLREAMKGVDSTLKYLALILDLESARLEPRQRQLLERAIAWGGQENRLFVSVGRSIMRAGRNLTPDDKAANRPLTLVADSEEGVDDDTLDLGDDDLDDDEDDDGDREDDD